MRQQRDAGFTIVELMIATVVFSIILLVITAAITQIGRLYYKGITNARTQEAARLVINDVSEAIQFNSGGIIDTTNNNSLQNGSNKAICIANRHISYALGQQRTGNYHAVVEQKVDSGCLGTQAQDLNQAANISGEELLGDKMRLANLVVRPVGGDSSQYTVIVRVVYGDIDLLCDSSVSSPGSPVDCTSSVSLQNESDISQIPNLANLSCKNIRSGTQFCAMSELSTIVKRRLVANP